MPDLEARWTGQAFTAFKSYNGNVTAASAKVQKALNDMGTALTNAGNEVTNAYVAVVELIGIASKSILNFVGSTAGSVQVDLANLVGSVAKAIIDVLKDFADGYNKAVQAALKNIAGYKTAANQAASAIAQLGTDLVPSLPQAAADKSSYVPVKAS
jgi:pyruvate-formate lyase-activating enzyme